MSKALLPVIFDFDDTCFGMMTRSCELTGIPIEKIVEFHTAENDLLTPHEQAQIMAAYHSPLVFQDIKFYPGFEEMLSLREIGIDPFIKTNCFTHEIADLKLTQIREKLPGLPRDHIILNVVNEKTALQKEIDESIFAFADDSPYNIAKSKARYNIIPIWPVNQSPRAQAILRDSGRELFQVEPGNLYTIYALLERLVKASS